MRQKDEDHDEDNNPKYEKINECHHYDKPDINFKDIDSVSETSHSRMVEGRKCIFFQGNHSTILVEENFSWRNNITSCLINGIKMQKIYLGNSKKIGNIY